MDIQCKRIYDEASASDGCRVLVDRLWPRGISKEEAELDDWLKEVAPSDELREQFHDDALSWDEFRREYLSELKHHREALKALVQDEGKDRLTLLFSSKDAEHNNAVVVEQYLKMLN